VALEDTGPTIMRHRSGTRGGVDFGGFGESTACVAFPLFTKERKLGGSLCIIGPDFRFSRERIENEFFPLLKEASRIISSKLGCNTEVRFG
jgi:DNA-binding IclR family transcriptional regulator